MQRYLHFNGELMPADEKLLNAGNRGLRYGDGVFETIRMTNGKMPLLSFHFDRLAHGLQTLQFEIPAYFNTAYLSEAIVEVCQKNNVEQSARIRVNAIRGNSIDDKTPGIIIESDVLTEGYDQFNEKGWTVDIYKEIKKSCDILSNLKSNNYLPYLMAFMHAQKSGLNDCLVLNSYERICDGTIANIFWVKDKQLFTPPLSEGCVSGVMRRYLLEKMREAGYPVEEKICTKLKLVEADEIFLTNSLFGIRWVEKLRDNTFTNKISLQLYKQFIKTLFSS